MYDLVKLTLIAGNGGNGRVSFRREKFIPKGGPDGGNAGSGGSIFFRASRELNTLQHFAGVKKFMAENGGDGGRERQFGSRGKDLILEVPIGTVVWLLAENKMARLNRLHPKHEGSTRPFAVLKRFALPSAAGGIVPPRPEDVITPVKLEQAPINELDETELAQDTNPIEELDGIDDLQAQILRSDSLHQVDIRTVPKIKIIEFTKDGQQELICEGGDPGRGNEAFKSATHTTPLEAEYGSWGEKKVVLLELRLAADIGLVGYPNAGKSTLLSIVTKANPKIANYPFTTLEPNLGVMHIGNELAGNNRDIVLADIPGLIEGAHEGKGLGFAFLRHVQTCKALLYVLSLDETVIFDDQLSNQEKAAELLAQYQVLKKELHEYDEALSAKPSLISVSKSDLYDPELTQVITELFTSEGLRIIVFSAMTHQGITSLELELAQLLPTK